VSTDRPAKVLSLVATTSRKTFKLSLRPGDKIICGRGPKCQIHVLSTDASVEHLEIYWTGSELILKDLASSNGTFRLPQMGPFKEAKFAPLMKEFSLIIANERVDFSWHLVGGMTETHIEKTAIVETPAPREVDKRAASANPMPSVLPHDSDARFNTQIRGDGVALKESLMSARLGALAALLFLASVAAYFASLAIWNKFLGPFLDAGVGSDLLLTWLLKVHDNSALLGLSFFAVPALVVFLLAKSLRSQAWLLRFLDLVPFRKWVWGASILIWTCAFAWPAMKGAGLMGFKTPMTAVAEVFEDITRTPSLAFDARLKLYRELSLKMQGSSYVYAGLFNAQMERVINQCDGQGDRPWDNKKICLVLLHAVPIETMESVKPVLVSSLAAQSAILLSLYGITRVMVVEGLRSATIPYFLNALALIGLENEQRDLNRIIYESGLDAKAVLESLRELRRQVDEHLSQEWSALPRPMHFVIPSPIEARI
jgi:hypothetical protein